MKSISKLIKKKISKIPLLIIGEYILIDNTNTHFIIKINSSNLLNEFKVYYIIENTDEYNVAEERYRPAFIFVGSKSKCFVSTIIRIPC